MKLPDVARKSAAVDTGLLDALSTADSIERCTDLILNAARAFGFGLVSLRADVSNPQNPSLEIGELGGAWRPEFEEEWARDRCRLASPIILLSRRTAWPFSWGPRRDDWSITANLNQKQRDVLDRIFTLEVLGAITVPVHMPGNRVGTVSWLTREAVAVQELLAAHRWFLMMCSQVALERLNMIRNSSAREFESPLLTSREVDCLNWVARGKSDHDIACIMGISYSSVRFHLNNATQKMNCVTRAHTIARASEQGWIAPL